MVLTCGETRRDITMCSAVSFRMRDQGSTRSPGHASTAGAAVGVGAAAAAGRAATGSGALGRGGGGGGGGGREGGGGGLDVAQDVVLGHPAGEPRSGNRAQIQVVLG